MSRRRFAMLLLLPALAAGGCLNVRVEPIRVEVDVTLRIEQQLNDIFADLDAEAAEIAEDITDDSTPSSD